ncbi:MAG TPA: SEC-C metal-binding domain-containing protein [Phycisphaerae bacterium]|nr:SEC-C metal-binding domain-containing protein [Phycisphaerae bacterium]
MSLASYPVVIAKSVAGACKRLIGSRNERLLKRLRPRADAVDGAEAEYRALTDEQLRERADALRTRFKPLVEEFEAPYAHLSPEQRRVREKEYRRQIKKLDRKIADLYFCEAAALVREASRRTQQHRHFNCQIIGGFVLYDGTIAEMKTGEGKTIVCHIAAFLKVLQGKKVHVITANDYLVSRDAEFARPVFEMLGMTVGYIQSQVDPGGREGIRRAAYAADITYGTNSEFGFDYLRDNMKTRAEDQAQGPLDFAIIDEVDSLLIDEARTPLIISGPAGDDVSRYPRADKVAADMVRKQNQLDRRLRSIVGRYQGDPQNIPKLDDAMRILGYRGNGRAPQPASQTRTDDGEDSDDKQIGMLGPDFLTDDQTEALQRFQAEVLGDSAADLYYRVFVVQRDRKQAQITHDGVTFAQEALDIGSLYAGPNVEWPHLLENALRAHKVYERDKDYVVQNGEVIIVDQFTGRLMPGRQWSDGLHQAVEAKEAVRVKQETQTLATITIQNYAHLYDKFAGMTGTALTEATEFMKIYELDVVEIPTNRPVNRIDYNDRIYRDVDEKYRAIVEEIHECGRRGRPADPFVIANVLAALRPIHARLGRDTSRIDAALEQFNQAQYGDRSVLDFMLQIHDEEMGDLASGRPVLVGTTSVENSERLSRLLERTYGIEHEVLNAKNHAREAEIIAKAGHRTLPTRGDKTPLGNVTIATNMAGRGTDIKLEEGVVYQVCKVPPRGDRLDQPIDAPEAANGGDGHGSGHAGPQDDSAVSLPVIDHRLYPPGVTKCCLRCEEYGPVTNCAHCFKPKLDPRFPDLGRKVCPINVPCGLHIIGTERHEARRIDNQLRGRSGRQGDPGSSRFFLSLEDDLLKLFMPDWMLKMMSKHAFESSEAAIEMKQLTKGIEKAQRKVEERNFSTRKNLLEWDEPMDYQRKAFYDARQEILEGHGLRHRIMDIIRQAVDEAVGNFLSGGYNAQCIVDWCREDLQVPISASDVADQPPERVQSLIRATAKDEARESIRRSIGEYVDPDEDPSSWDLGGLQAWVQRAYKVAVSKNQLRKMDADQITDLLIESAEDYFDHLNLDGIVKFTDPDYPYSALGEWARSRFDIDFGAAEAKELPPGAVADKIEQLVRAKYRRREIEYPVDYTVAKSAALAGTNKALLAQAVLDWTNSKYRLGWKPDRLEGRTLQDVRDELVKLNEQFLEGDRLERQVDEALSRHQGEELEQWAAQRFGPAWSKKRFELQKEDPRQALLDIGRLMLTWELAQLEHRVLLQLYDQVWKDHLWEMDRLEDAIKQRPLGGDQTHPQSQYAIEGRELFNEMWSRLRARIVDLILKVHATPGAPPEAERRPASPMQAMHADATGAGFTGASADYQAAMQAQGAGQKVETIRRDQPKVGRNDPCPCGSGKKFKQCHGRK